MDDLLSEFLTETNEYLDSLDVELVRLERNPNDRALIGNIFRLVHTIKGTCGFLGLARLEAVAHAAENVLVNFRDGSQAVTPATVTLILESLDRIKALLSALERTGSEPEGDDTELIDRLERMCSANGAATVPDETAPAPSPEATPVGEPGVAGQSIRINVALLENLMTMVSELVLTRNQLMQMVRQVEDSAFEVPLQRLSHVTTDLQEGVMKTRMQPIGNAWGKLPRIIRDLSHELGKKIELQMLGADTELDRQVLEMIKDPLTHMVRNAADHGIETAAERAAAGKPETGTVVVNAYHEGGHILIEISDDGRGIDVEQVRRKVLEKGLASAADVVAMSDRQVLNFIARPGFTTAEAVTAVSGRGVGMDVVRTNIEKIGGRIDLRSTAGKGATFTVKIPLTLAIVSALIVECRGERFAVPQSGVRELVRITRGSEHRVERINDTPVLRLRDRLLPLVSLAEVLALGPNEVRDFIADGGDTAARAPETFVVVVQVGNDSFGIVVDRVLDTEEIVVKPVAPILRDIPVYSGNTILGDGSVIMILDPNGIAAATGEMTMAEDGMTQGTGPAEETDRERMAFLVFRTRSPGLKAVPLALVSRLEEIDRATIEYADGQPVVQYRGTLMPLLSIDGTRDLGAEGRQPVLVFTDRGRSVGLLAEEIIDIVEDHLEVELASGKSGVLGSAVIAGKAADVIDAAAFLTEAHGERLGASRDGEDHGAADRRSILLVEDSPFFRNLLTPLLRVAGYDVTTTDSADKALSMRDSGHTFDAIVSDIEMPGMNGRDFAGRVRDGGTWQETPLLALSSHTLPADLPKGHEAGFDDYVTKLDRDALLRSLSQRFDAERSAA